MAAAGCIPHEGLETALQEFLESLAGQSKTDRPSGTPLELQELL